MKEMFEHTINSRVLTTFSSVEHELKFNKQKNYLFDLSYLSVLEVTGDKSLDFLQGQLTCDVRLVSDIQMLQGVQCNLKGRILALLDIILWGNYKLILPMDLVESTQTSLNKTAQLSRVSIQRNNKLKIFGLYLQNHNDLIPDKTFLPNNLYAQAQRANYCYYHLGNGFYIFIIKTEIEEEFCKPFKEQDQLLGSLTWHTLRLYAQQFEIYPESRGLFLPHRLGLHQTQYISFDKGCYKGQEIIARTHYKATIKHELNIYVIQSEQAIYSGQKLLKVDEDVELGELIDYSLLGDKNYLITASTLKQAPQMVRFEGQSQPISLEKL
ncbi:CAF17-like 4Fe-4S cluster assembly/insertion protein YgfZ [Legionella fallonii]|nr:glycine cleavage system protein T [Legionella fallonii]